MEVVIIFPHQLFKSHPALNKTRTVYLVEEWLFFKQYQFHKQKIQFHRATMQCYKDFLIGKAYDVQYVESSDVQCDVRSLIASLAAKKVRTIHIADPVDDWLRRRVKHACNKFHIQLVTYVTPAFLNNKKDADSFFGNRQTYFQTDFYIDQRKKRNLLMDGNKPLGGKWTFDSENRQKFPKAEIIPSLPVFDSNQYIEEAILYTERHFAHNYGQTGAAFVFDNKAVHYPVSFDEAEHWLDDFLQNRFEKFGIYEDAMVEKEPVLYHGTLSMLLNTGLLTPKQVLEKALDTAVNADIPLNSLEGFIRQLTGWREFIRIVYEREGRRQRTSNYFNFKRKIPRPFWNGTTGIQPIDIVIKRVLHSGYAHHIERLMVLGNFMLLCEFDPDDVYRWFMEMFVDAYDWVMVPNVYGMTQFADGGLMMTKPYISGSNYLMKMGDWQKGAWQQTWDALFWRFMHVHRDFFLRNPRLGMLIKTFDKMPAEKKQIHLQTAEAFLHQLDQ